MTNGSRKETLDANRPPVPKAVPHPRLSHGETRADDYHWIGNREDPNVLRYLEEENEYTEREMEHTESLQKTLFNEAKGYIKEPDESVPVEDGPYMYYSRRDKGAQYWVLLRKKIKRGGALGDEEVVLDENAESQGHPDYAVGGSAVSPNHRYLALAEDTTGSELYTLSIKDLKTGKRLKDKVPNLHEAIAWSNDSQYIFYSVHSEARVPYAVYRHKVGEDAKSDVLVYAEKNSAFGVGVSGTRSRGYIVLGTGDFRTAECMVVNADRPLDKPMVIVPREEGHEYSVSHYGKFFYISTNKNAKDFRIIRVSVDNPSIENWKTIIPEVRGQTIEGMQVFKNVIALERRVGGIVRIFLHSHDGRLLREIPTNTTEGNSGLGENPMAETNVIRFARTSFLQPTEVCDYDVKTGKTVVRKTQEIPSGYEKNEFVSEKIEATALDGKTKIPISLVYMKGARDKGTAPLVLYAYGAYGLSTDAGFSAMRLSLLRRGVIFAIAHIRGGGEMGRDWRDQGTKMNKTNSFDDYIQCANHLITSKYTSSDRMVGMGGSAGGMLMGNVANRQPKLFKALVAHVPSVEVVNAGEDKLKAGAEEHYSELGDPKDSAVYKYQMTYDPYENVNDQEYPNMLVTTGFNDLRVPYWTPVKFVAKIRAHHTGGNKILLRTYLGKGHFGHAALDPALGEWAFDTAYILDQLGIRR